MEINSQNILSSIVISLILLPILTKIYQKLSIAWCKSQTCLVGKTALITGANTGIGYETALDLAKRGARVILACRDEKKATEARDKIIEETGNANIAVKIIDMSSFESVRNFAKDINANEERLDILVNNAGAVVLPRKKTVDGNLMLIQVNYLSHFLLTHLLGKLLKKSGASRVINVSSYLASFAKLDVNNLNKRDSHQLMYNNSKACNMLFTRELAKRLEGTEITTFSLHPGAVNTEIFRNVGSWHRILFQYFLTFYFKDAAEGAQTSIYTSVAKGIEKHNGGHFEECRKSSQYKTTQDMNIAKKLWKNTEELIQFKSGEKQF